MGQSWKSCHYILRPHLSIVQAREDGKSRSSVCPTKSMGSLNTELVTVKTNKRTYIFTLKDCDKDQR